jgi:NMD protein affecting ribosome stability and mRNA decay
MSYRITVGQNQWLITEYVGARGGTTMYQVTESHRLPQIKVGDMIHFTRKGMFIAYSNADALRPTYRLPSHSQMEGWYYEEE